MPAPQYKTFQINCPAGAVPVVVPMAGLQFAFLAASVNIQGVVAGFDSGSMAEWAVGIELGTKVSARLYIASNVAQVVTVAVADGTATIRDSRAAPVGIQPISAADGAIVSLGTTTDAKVVSSDSNGTLIALTKGLLDKYLGDSEAAPADNFIMTVGGINAGVIRAIEVDSVGRTIVAGNTSSGSSASGSPIQMSGVDGGNLVRRIATDTGGNITIVGAEVAGAAPSVNGVRITASDGNSVRSVKSDPSGRLLQGRSYDPDIVVGTATALAAGATINVAPKTTTMTTATMNCRIAVNVTVTGTLTVNLRLSGATVRTTSWVLPVGFHQLEFTGSDKDMALIGAVVAATMDVSCVSTLIVGTVTAIARYIDEG